MVDHSIELVTGEQSQISSVSQVAFTYHSTAAPSFTGDVRSFWVCVNYTLPIHVLLLFELAIVLGSFLPH